MHTRAPSSGIHNFINGRYSNDYGSRVHIYEQCLAMGLITLNIKYEPIRGAERL